MEGLAGWGSFLVFISTGLTFCAMIMQIVGFSTDNLLVGNESPFVRIGFHKACFDECRNPLCPAGDQFIYTGCYYLWDYYYKEIEKWLRPQWFTSLRDLAIVSLPLVMICFFVLLAASIVVACWRYPRAKTNCRDMCVHCCLMFTCLLLLGTSILMIIIITKFYMRAHDYGWMPMPSRNDFGWSFWLMVVATLCMILSFVTSLMAFVFKLVHVSHPLEDPKQAEDMMMGQMGGRLDPIAEC